MVGVALHHQTICKISHDIMIGRDCSCRSTCSGPDQVIAYIQMQICMCNKQTTVNYNNMISRTARHSSWANGSQSHTRVASKESS